MLLPSSYKLLILSLGLALVGYLPSPALAQDDDPDDVFGALNDAYGDIREPEVDPNNPFGAYSQPQVQELQAAPNQPTDSKAAAFSLLGESTSRPAFSIQQPQWGQFDSLTGAKIEDTYEMKMKKELSKPLPKRSPFGDVMKDLKETLNTPKK